MSRTRLPRIPEAAVELACLADVIDRSGADAHLRG
jgi:hypothetical protein